MGWESSDVVRFDLEPLLQGQTRTAKLRRVYNSFIIDPIEVCNVKPTCRILCAGNLLMSDLTFGPSFKVKRWFTGFGELSFRWIQICIGSPIRRSSFICRAQSCIFSKLKNQKLQTSNQAEYIITLFSLPVPVLLSTQGWYDQIFVKVGHLWQWKPAGCSKRKWLESRYLHFSTHQLKAYTDKINWNIAKIPQRL